MNSIKEKKKKKKKRKKWPVVLTVIGILAAAVLIVIFMFRTRSYKIDGNVYYSDNTIMTWVGNDDFSSNSLYVVFKYKFLDPDLPVGVEQLHVSLKNPWTVRVNVEEKEMAGYVMVDDEHLYFDDEGTAIMKTKKVFDNVPCIEGLEFDASKVETGKTIPVEDKSIFEKIMDVSRNLKKYNLKPDRVTCTDGEIRIYFGSVETLLGVDNYEQKLQQVQPILDKLNELYPGQAGTLHLENYSSESGSVRFVPAS